LSKEILSKIKFPLIIDGGLSNVLEDFGCDLNNELWVANILTTNPEAIIKTHLAYLEAGAQIISTSSYQATIPGFMKLGFTESESEMLIIKSVELASTALQRFIEEKKNSKTPLIAGSIGPFGAFLADGSEYSGNYNITDKELKVFHERRIRLLDESGCDILALETIPSFQELKIISEILKTTNKQAWVSFSCKDENHINDGTTIKKCAIFLKSHPNVFAIGVNCTLPKYISGLIINLKQVLGDKKIIIYPNSGESYNAKSKTWFGISDPELFSEMADEWLDLGADIIGGCCRIGTLHIKHLKEQIEMRSN
jgi:homocysteine S-methyltransferase